MKGNFTKSCRNLFIGATYLFLYVPLIVLFVYSFNVESFPSPWTSFSLKWYAALFDDLLLWSAFRNSLLIACVATFLSVLMGALLVFSASQGGKIGRYLNLYYGNLIVPETVLAIALLGFFALIAVPFGLPTLIIAHTILGIGYVVPITYAKYQEIDPRLSEASLVMGATPIQTFFRITLPLLIPTLITSGLLVFIISFDDFILSYFCAGSATQTLSLYILSMLRTGVSPVVNALSAVLLVLSSGLALLFFSLRSKTRIL